MLVENCCEHVEYFIQHLEDYYGDEEIIEALYENSIQHQEYIIEDQTSHLDLNDNLLNGQMNSTLVHSFTELFVQEETCENQNFEIACMETLGSEPIHDGNYPHMQEVAFLYSFENQNNILVGLNENI